MMNNNKILTVSYGTFSCTLEGFEDSFDTMKAIAEYFRDLAADDRYFGAEPPQPDADMLARIAEREVSRRVEAHEHEGRIMLKAHDDVATPTPAEQAPAAAPMATVAAAAAEPELPTDDFNAVEEETQAFSAPYTDMPEPPVQTPIEGYMPSASYQAPQAQPDQSYGVEAPEVAVEPIKDTVITEAEIEVEPTESFDRVATEDDIEDLAALDGVAEEDAPELMAQPHLQEDASVDGVSAARIPEELDSAAAFFADSVVEDAPEPEMEEAISVEAFTGYISPVEDEVAETEGTFEEHAFQEETFEEAEQKQEASFEDSDDLILDEADEPQPAFPTESFADKLARIRAVVSKRDDEGTSDGYEDEDQGEAPAMGSFDMEVDNAVEDALSAEEPKQAEDNIVSEVAIEIEEALELDESEPASDQEEMLEDEIDTILGQHDASDWVEVDVAADMEENVDLRADDAAQEEDENLFGETQAPEVDAAEGPAPVQGRVMKVSSADLDAALNAGDLEEFEVESEASEASLDDEDQDQQGDLNALEDEIAAMDGDDLPEDNDKSAAARESLPEIDTDTSEDVSRLMAEADQQMEEPEGRTRRSAFSHLRAAVAARFADRSMDDEAAEAREQAEAYRSDLAEVVKPRRPESSDERSERPVDTGPAPLKLVAEQRIHPGAPAQINSVAPRRVAASADDEVEIPSDSGFADYAEERGATTLPELLEAAASYLCFVEGQDEFSRPQLMTRVRQADVGEFTREDGLRSFGQLLRTGKIEKIKGGRFVASDAIGYKPDQRAVG